MQQSYSESGSVIAFLFTSINLEADVSLSPHRLMEFVTAQHHVLFPSTAAAPNHVTLGNKTIMVYTFTSRETYHMKSSR